METRNKSLSWNAAIGTAVATMAIGIGAFGLAKQVEAGNLEDQGAETAAKQTSELSHILLVGAGALLCLAGISGSAYALGRLEEKRELAANNPAVFDLQQYAPQPELQRF